MEGRVAGLSASAPPLHASEHCPAATRGLIIKDDAPTCRGDFKDNPALALAIAQKKTICTQKGDGDQQLLVLGGEDQGWSGPRLTSDLHSLLLGWINMPDSRCTLGVMLRRMCPVPVRSNKLKEDLAVHLPEGAPDSLPHG